MTAGRLRCYMLALLNVDVACCLLYFGMSTCWHCVSVVIYWRCQGKVVCFRCYMLGLLHGVVACWLLYLGVAKG